EEGVHAVDHFAAVGVPGQKIGPGMQRIVEESLVKPAIADLASGLPKIPPGHPGFQLIAAWRLRPAERIVIERALAGQCEDGVKTAVGGGEIARHGVAYGASAIQELHLAGGAPGGEQTARDDAAIEE